MSTFKNNLLTIIDGTDISEQDAYELMERILKGELASEQLAALLVALLAKGESLTEVKGFVRAMRDAATHLRSDLPVVDTCGTGGDGAHTFNISTTAAIIAAGAGTPIAKHHNRSVSSKCGSADLLEALNVDIQMPLDKVEHSVNELGIGFCFAPLFHPSMRHAAPARQALGIRTIFNLLGPLLNPFNAKRQIIGVFSPEKLMFVAELLRELGSERVLVLHGSDGLDEATLTGSTRVVELNKDTITEYDLDPGDLGLSLSSADDLVGGDAAGNAAITLSVLEGKPGPQLDISLLNAALAIYVGQDDLELDQALNKARNAVESGNAMAKLRELQELSKQ